MKKYMLGFFVLVFVFSLLSINVPLVSAESDSNYGCSSGDKFNRQTGERCAVQVIRHGCQSGDKYSSITGELCWKPGTVVISGVSGPQNLKVGQKGTWKITAYDKNGGNLSYSVIWGDEKVDIDSLGSGYAGISAKNWKQTAKFTHKFSQSGIYTSSFKVMNQDGDIAETSLSVNVGNTASTSKITVFSPNGGETWKKGTNKTITWQSNKTAKYDIFLVSKSNTQRTIAKKVYTSSSNFKGSYAWSVGKRIPADYSDEETIAPDGLYKIKVCETGTSTCDSSDSYFTISKKDEGHDLTLRPIKSGTKSYYAGDRNVVIGEFEFKVSESKDITINDLGFLDFVKENGDYKSLVSKDFRNLSLWVDGVRISHSISGITLSGNTPGSFNFVDTSFTIPRGSIKKVIVRADISQYASNSSHYLMLASFGAFPEITSNFGADLRDSTVNISGNNTSFPLTVLSPNGGESWVTGANKTITWQSNKVSTYDISLHPVSTPCTASFCTSSPIYIPYTIAKNVYSSSSTLQGSYSWQVGNTTDGSVIPAGTYKIQVCETGMNVCDSSDSSFSIITLETIAQPSQVLGAEAFTFTQKLMRGSQGSEVMELQKYLKEAGYYNGNLDGKFGLATEAGLIKFQTAKNIKADGIVGAEMRAILNK